jgi:tRNA pseudouridine13 synthase
MEKHDLVESPRKRQKTSDAGPEEIVVAGDGAADVPTTPGAAPDAQAVKEVEVGITEFVSSDNEGFSGILKKR